MASLTRHTSKNRQKNVKLDVGIKLLIPINNLKILPMRVVMKSILQIFSAKTAQKFALVGLTSIVITACGGPETATPKLKDTLGPKITLNAAGDLAKVQATDGTTSYKPSSEVSKSDHVIAYKQSHDLGVDFTDPGAVARDLWEGYKTYQTEGSIDTNTQGIQSITYTAHDSSGNISTLIREVEVIDATPPVITLNGEPTELVILNTTFDDPSATAVDAVDGVIAGQPTILIEEKSKQDGSFSAADFDSSETTEYRYTYTFTDAAGNSASLSRKVLVIPADGAKVVILEKGAAGEEFDSPIQAFDQDLNWNSCYSANCPSIDFGFVDDDDRDHQVLQVSHAATTAGAGIFISSSDPIDLRGSREDGIYQLDLKVISGDRRISFKADCGYPCGGGNQDITVSQHGVWETIAVPVEDLIPNGPEGNILDLEIVKGGLVIQATGAYGTVFRIDNVIWKCGTTCEGVDIPFVPVDWESTHEDKAVGYDAPTSYDGYTQVWADEFAGNAVDFQKWGFDLGNGDGGWGNGELQHYRVENASVDNGMLIIEARKHQPALDGGIRFTSSKLKTAGKFEFKYGRVDIRAVVAEGQGLWSAGWMLGANHSQIGWPYSGEIDIVDTIGGVRGGIPQDGMIVHNMYWNATGSDKNQPYSPANINLNGSAEVRINDSNEGETFSNKFHVFSIIWDKNKIQFQVDGVNTESVNLTNTLADTFRNPFYLILNVAVGGAWPGSPGDNMNFPDGMLVDYVRVYQEDSDGDGVADFDLDGDTPLDAFPNNPDESADSDGDGIGDNADQD
jgi:beta-glucanase (GH16 family)